MATVVKYLEYSINLTDRAIATAQQTAHPAGVYLAPDQAAIDYPATILANTSSPYFKVPSQYPTNVASFVRKVGGWFGLSFLFGSTYTYRWVGKFVYVGTDPQINGAPIEQAALAKRRFLVSFDSPSSMEMASLGGTDMRSCHRGASRHGDGMGYYYTGAGTVQVV